VVAVECRTAGQSDSDRRAFLVGLSEGVRQVHPQHVLVYGGLEHRHWLTSHLPEGSHYILLESWTHARDRQRRQKELTARHRNQLTLFQVGGTQQWADEDQAAVA